MSVSVATVLRAAPSMPAGIPVVMQGRELVVATTLVMEDAIIAARTET